MNVRRLLKFIGVWIVAASMSTAAFAGKYNLIEKDGSPSLAKSHKSLGAGKHEFVIDGSKKLSRDKPITYDFLKKSIEGKLGASHGAKVEGDASKIVVTYEGDEKGFLKAIAKTKIRTKFKTSLASNQMGGDSGIRAQKKGATPPKPNEVYGKVVMVKEDHVKIQVLKLGGKGMTTKVGKKMIKVAPTEGMFEKGKGVYFVPVKMTGGMWQIKGLRSEK